MAANAMNLPVEQIHRFWEEVEQVLRDHYRLRSDEALHAIVRFRNETERVGALRYHLDPADIARDIVEGGYSKV